MKFTHYILILLFFTSCENECYLNAQEFKKKECHMLLLSKEDSSRYYIYKGISLDGEKVRWCISSWSNLYKEAEEGDSISKDTGNTSIFLWKHKLNKTIELEFICGGTLYQ